MHPADFIQQIYQILRAYRATRPLLSSLRYDTTGSPKAASVRGASPLPPTNRYFQMQIYVEPLPRGRWGPIDGYSLEYPDGTKITDEVFRSEKLAVREIKLRGYKPLLAKVRITDKRDGAHWEATD
jgi:hypothetical protein